MIAIDWGTTHLRAYRLTASGEIEARKTTTKGIMAVAPGGFAAVLEEVLGDWPDLSNEPILMSGMIGSRQGWPDIRRKVPPANLGDCRSCRSSGLARWTDRASPPELLQGRRQIRRARPP